MIQRRTLIHGAAAAQTAAEPHIPGLAAVLGHLDTEKEEER